MKGSWIGVGLFTILVGIVSLALTGVGLHIESMLALGGFAILGGLATAIYGGVAKPSHN